MTELETLRAKLADRSGKPGWAENCRDLETRIKQLETNDGKPTEDR